MNTGRSQLFSHLSSFFDSLDAWHKASPALGIDSKLTQIEYDDLLKGTNAHMYVPLWTSCAKSGTKLLMSEVTLDVIKFYKACGWQPRHMDGNPPDYLGEEADIRGIRAAVDSVCGKGAVPLLVDNAHGAYLRFLPESRHPLDLGAMCRDAGTDLEELITEIIIGPESTQSVPIIQDYLRDLSLDSLADRVCLSECPLRSKM